MLKKTLLVLSLVFSIFAIPQSVKNKISKDIHKIINSVDPDINIGLEVVKSGEVLFSHKSKNLFTPASNTKLFTAAAALFLLKPDYVFETKIYTDNQNNIYIRGSGDPSLEISDLEKAVNCLKDNNIKYIRNIIIDDTMFDNVLFGTGWMWDDSSSFYNAPISSINLNHNCINTKLSLDSKKNKVVKNPALFTGIIFRDLLIKYGINISGKLVNRCLPKNAKLLYCHKSKPLHELLAKMLKDSDNLYAECFFKKIGTIKGKVGSAESGKEELYNFLNNIVKLDTSRLLIVDGSGMSRYNLISPEHIINLLDFMYESKYKDIFINCLSKAGIDGTLKNRLLNLSIMAKTGSLQGVSGVSGYIITKDKKPIVFSILINGFVGPIKTYKDLEDKIMQYFGKLSVFKKNLFK